MDGALANTRFQGRRKIDWRGVGGGGWGSGSGVSHSLDFLESSDSTCTSRTFGLQK